MRGIPRPSPAMVVALIALVVAIGGTAAALPGKFTVGRDDLRPASVGARALGSMYIGNSLVLESQDSVANDGEFTESVGTIVCPPKAPTAIDPFIGGMGPTAFITARSATTNRLGAPRGYRFTVSSDDGPDVGYVMKVNCLFAR
jgi:hypothetical protein